jgi:uncharacterized protein (TIGR02145 family)
MQKRKNLVLGLLLLTGAISVNAQENFTASKFYIGSDVVNVGNVVSMLTTVTNGDAAAATLNNQGSAAKFYTNGLLVGEGTTVTNEGYLCVNCRESYPPVPTVWLAYRNSDTGPITDWIEFMSYNLGAQPLSIKEQLLFVSPTTSSTAPYADKAAAETAGFPQVYGSLYQWGRKSDDHQYVWTATATTPTTGVPNANIDTNGQVKSGVAGYGQFVTNTASKYDWIANDAPTSTNNYQSYPGRWDGGSNTAYPTTTTLLTPRPARVTNGNDPCPVGFKVPSTYDWQSIAKGGTGTVSSGVTTDIVNKWVWVAKDANLTTASHGASLDGVTAKTAGYLIYPPVVNGSNVILSYATEPVLFLPAAGIRGSSSGSCANGGQIGLYWSSQARNYESVARSYNLHFEDNNVTPMSYYPRASGLSVRCVAD